MTHFYTVIEATGGFSVRYVEPPDWQVQETGRVYADPGEATREFKKFARFQSAALLSKTSFEQRIRRHQADLAKLRSWSRQ